MARSSISFLTRQPRWTLGFLVFALLGFLITPWLLASDQRVSAEDFFSNRNPAVAHLADGTTVYAWGTDFGGATSSEVFVRRFDSAGFPLGGPILVNSVSEGAQVRPDVEGDGSGGFVVVWQQIIGSDPRTTWGRIFASDGSPMGSEFQINETALGGYTSRPEVAVQDDGAFIVVWESPSIDGSQLGVAGRRFDASGMALGPEFVLTEATQGSQSRPNIAMDGDGDFLVTWRDSGIQGRFFSSDGTPQSGDLELANISNFFSFTDVAMTPDGRFALAYILDSLQTPTIQRFDASGIPLEGPIALSADTTTRKDEPVIAAHSDGTFHVVWESLYLGAADDVFARTVRPDGTLEGTEEVKVNQVGTTPAFWPDVASNGAGGAIYTWTKGLVRPQIFTNCDGLGPCAIFSDGFESGGTAAWSTASPP